MRDSNASKLHFTPSVPVAVDRPSFKLLLTTPLPKPPPKLTETPVISKDVKVEKEAKPANPPSVDNFKEGENKAQENGSESLKRRIEASAKCDKRVKVDFLLKTPARPADNPAKFKGFASELPKAAAEKLIFTEISKQKPAETVKNETKSCKIVPPPAIIDAVAYISSRTAVLEREKSMQKAVVRPPSTAVCPVNPQKTQIFDLLTIQLQAEMLITDCLEVESSLNLESILRDALHALSL